MDKIEILEKQINQLLKDNYPDELIKEDIKLGNEWSSARKSSFEYVLEMIKDIKSEK